MIIKSLDLNKIYIYKSFFITQTKKNTNLLVFVQWHPRYIYFIFRILAYITNFCPSEYKLHNFYFMLGLILKY